MTWSDMWRAYWTNGSRQERFRIAVLLFLVTVLGVLLVGLVEDLFLAVAGTVVDALLS